MKQRPGVAEAKKPQRQRRVMMCPTCGLYKPIKQGTNQVSAHNSSVDYSKLCSGSDNT